MEVIRVDPWRSSPREQIEQIKVDA